MAPLRLAQLSILKNEPEEKVWANLEKALEMGYLFYHDLVATPDFVELKKSPSWTALLRKYFPEAKD